MLFLLLGLVIKAEIAALSGHSDLLQYYCINLSYFQFI